MEGRIHSFQSLGTLDGPGVRFVTFLQGCPLRCACCHNPDTWEREGGMRLSAQQVFDKAARFHSYFGSEGGVTVSGGEPLLQAEFVAEYFSLCREAGIGTALDTSGCIWNEAAERLLPLCDLVLLDFKMTNEPDYFRYTRMHMETVERFLAQTERFGVGVWIRQVMIPGINDTEQSVRLLCEKTLRRRNVQRIELLPFKKLCSAKYEQMGIAFPLAETPEPEPAHMEALREEVRRCTARLRGAER